MIKGSHVNQYCAEDISLIENYDKAIADNKNIWVCHHRAEILPCGIFSKETLIKFGLYYNRPANELVFMKLSEHRKIHTIGSRNPFYRKQHSLAQRQKWSKERKGNKLNELQLSNFARWSKGLHYYNNGHIELRAKECPDGFVKGRIHKNTKPVDAAEE